MAAHSKSRVPSNDDSRSLSKEAASDIVGYLNFSNGRPDSRFQARLNDLFAGPGETLLPAASVREALLAAIHRLKAESPAFADAAQAEAVVPLVFDVVLPAYRQYHADLLFHLPASEFEQPLFLARLFEAVLEQGPPWTETERIVDGALDRLNDFVGHRPVAVLENNRKMEPYPHERFRPIPLYIQGVGPANGRYRELIEHTIQFLRDTPDSILQDSYFELSQMEELALDIRAHDHLHPVNKRTNYMFGEWDPSQIDIKGRYRRFVLRQIILDALLRWMDSQTDVPREEVLFDASAVLCGTMLMASSISGSGPSSFDSSMTLSGLLPKVARQRDAFYERLLQTSRGARGRRLNEQARVTRQPFGHVRQRLNIELANYGARQVQYRHLAQLYARMGFAEAAQRQAAIIPSASARMETEIRWRLAAVHQKLDQGNLADAAPYAAELESLLQRGIGCGAIVDPWNVLGFQGQFPLFHSREDSLPDQRVEMLLELMEEVFVAFSRLLNEAAAQGQRALYEQLADRYRRLADDWDRYATSTVEDLPRVNGRECFESAEHVSRVLSEWRSAGEAAGDISFWRQHIDDFQSAKSYALVVDALLQRNDTVASMGLLMQWLSQAEEVGLESGPHSLYSLLLRWMDIVIATGQAVGDKAGLSTLFRRLFSHLEANAGSFWSAPALEEGTLSRKREEDEELEEPLPESGDESSDAEDEEGELFEAAYDDVIWRDSAEDGHSGDTLDDHVAGAQNTEFELLARRMEPRLRFLTTVADLWQRASIILAGQGLNTFPESSPGRGLSLSESVRNWRERAERMQRELAQLLQQVRDYELAAPSGDFESNIEFDAQHQTKLFLLHTIIGTTVGFRLAERYLACCLEEKPAGSAKRRDARLEQLQLDVARAIFRRDPGNVRRRLPELIRALANKPLLYVSLENDGEPMQVLEARILQSSLRFLLSQLPGLGLVSETWRLLFTAFRMERKSPPIGQAVTEFDRLFRIGMRSVLESLCRSARTWRVPAVAFAGRRNAWFSRERGLRRMVRARIRPEPSLLGRRGPRRTTATRAVAAERRPLPLRPARSSRHSNVRYPRWFSDHLLLIKGISEPTDWRDVVLVSIVHSGVQAFQELWLRHSRTMRLSTVEAIQSRELFNDLRTFIQTYGHDLFHARMLMIGNVRAILHNGVETFLEHLDENEDPLHPVPLLEALRDQEVDRDDVIGWMELIYGAIVDKFERFLEYNTTTTQSDYGEMLYCLLDFLRVEAAYDRDAWELAPFNIAHELLAEQGWTKAARIWETLVRMRTQGNADRHIQAIRQAETTHGMRLPSMSDHLNERFVKPLAVNRMSALVPRVVQDARAGISRSQAFEALRQEVNDYLESTSGSGIDVPSWLRNLEREVDRALSSTGAREGHEQEIRLAPHPLTLKQTQRQIESCERFVEQLLDRRRT